MTMQKRLPACSANSVLASFVVPARAPVAATAAAPKPRMGQLLPSIAMTADVPPGPARRCGLGIVTIGSLSGRPIIPFAVATSHYRAVNSWDRMTVNLPFSRLGIVMGNPIFVPPKASGDELENHRRRVENALNVATTTAYALAGANAAKATPHAGAATNSS